MKEFHIDDKIKIICGGGIGGPGHRSKKEVIDDLSKEFEKLKQIEQLEKQALYSRIVNRIQAVLRQEIVDFEYNFTHKICDIIKDNIK